MLLASIVQSSPRQGNFLSLDYIIRVTGAQKPMGTRIASITVNINLLKQLQIEKLYANIKKKYIYTLLLPSSLASKLVCQQFVTSRVLVVNAFDII